MIRFTVSVLALSAALGAQTRPDIQISLSTADAVAVNANRMIDGARAGTTIDRVLTLSANDGRSVQASSSAGRAISSTPQGPGFGGQFQWSGFASSGNVAGTLAGNPLAPGAQSYTLSLASRADVMGSVVVIFGGSSNNARAGGTVRIGRDTRSFAADGNPQREVFTGVTVGSGGVDIAIGLAGRAAPDANTRGAAYRCEMRVSFIPDGSGGGGCTVTPGQRSCAEGGQLMGAVEMTRRGAVLNMGLQNALPDAIGLTIVSATGNAGPIGNTRCVFFDDAAVVGTFTTDANGAARQALPFRMMMGGSFSVQQATLIVSPRGVRFATSNTLDIACN